MTPMIKADLSGTWVGADKPKLRCTWQTGRALGYHVTVFCTDLNLFYDIHFPIFNSSACCVCNIAFQYCHNTLRHCQMSTEWAADHTNRQTCLTWAKVQLGWKHSLKLMPQKWWNWRIKWMNSVSMRGLFGIGANWIERLFIPVTNCTEFQSRI